MTELDQLPPSRQAVAGDAVPSLQSLFPTLTRIAPLPLALQLPNQQQAHGHVPATLEANQTQAGLSHSPSLTWRNQPSQTTKSLEPEAHSTANLVDSLFDHAMQQRVMPDLSLRMLPQPVTESRNVASDSVSATSERPRPRMPQTAPLTVPLNRSDVAQIADQVARVLKQRARSERERGGHY